MMHAGTRAVNGFATICILICALPIGTPAQEETPPGKAAPATPPKTPPPPRPPPGVLSPEQVAALQKRAQSPRALGVMIDETGVRGVNLIAGAITVTVPMAPTGTEEIAESPFALRAPVVIGTINGHTNVNVMVDSGATSFLVGYTLAQRLKIPLVKGHAPIAMGPAGTHVKAYLAVIPELRFASLRCRNMLSMIGADLLAFRFLDRYRPHSQVIVANVGSFRLGLAYLTMDFPAHTMTFAPLGPFIPDTERKVAARLPMTWRHHKPYVQIDLGDGRLRECLIDTGSQFGVGLPRAVAEEIGQWPATPQATVKTVTVHGLLDAVTYRIDTLKLGTTKLTDVPAVSLLRQPKRDEFPLLIGNEILARFRVTFDFRNSLLWLEQ